MAKLSFYGSVEEKSPHFNQGDVANFKIDTASQFIQWYDQMKNALQAEGPFGNFFIGYYDLKSEQQDFPLLSILQHYNAPTPLMDWTYAGISSLR